MIILRILSEQSTLSAKSPPDNPLSVAVKGSAKRLTALGPSPWLVGWKATTHLYYGIIIGVLATLCTESVRQLQRQRLFLLRLQCDLCIANTKLVGEQIKIDVSKVKRLVIDIRK